MTDIQNRLFELQDISYQAFMAKLIPNIDKTKVIGVRTPQLKKLAKEIIDNNDADTFLSQLPHTYFEENQLHSFIISLTKDFDKTVEQIDLFLPYVDNWAVCDQLLPKNFRKNKDKLVAKITDWLGSEHTYTIRFAIGVLMKHFLDEDFKPEYLQLAAGVTSEEYYVKMMQAWYFAEALAKQYDTALSFIENHSLDPWTHNKAIQKARESRRVSDEHKLYLNTLKV